MTAGGLARYPAELVVAITGVAGPEPDEDGNPVGLVYVAAAARDGRLRVERHQFRKRCKDEICAAAMVAALALLEDFLNAALSGARIRMQNTLAPEDPSQLDPFQAAGVLRVIVETPRGTGVKLGYLPKLRTFRVARALTRHHLSLRLGLRSRDQRR